VTLANAIGTGVADDKSIYPYVPEMIRFYLSEEPVLSNVPTFLLHGRRIATTRSPTLPELVVKETHGAGGYGMLIGPCATAAEIDAFRQRILAAPEKYIAQPTLALSTCPTFVESGLAPRHVDLRPYVLSGKTTNLVPGGSDARRAARRARWSSTRRRAGARRTPGSCQLGDSVDDALPHRQRALLDVAPHRARREHARACST
jgi:uncharacterized circularly permuted ATP-grasp superfamily protein